MAEILSVEHVTRNFGGLAAVSNVSLNLDAGELVGLPCGVAISNDVAAGVAQADCLIDFTRPEGTLHHLELARAAGCGMVIGTTGFSADGKAAIAAAAEHIPVGSGTHVDARLLSRPASTLQERSHAHP